MIILSVQTILFRTSEFHASNAYDAYKESSLHTMLTKKVHYKISPRREIHEDQ